jgi:hypothetical protein
MFKWWRQFKSKVNYQISSIKCRSGHFEILPIKPNVHFKLKQESKEKW